MMKRIRENVSLQGIALYLDYILRLFRTHHPSTATE